MAASETTARLTVLTGPSGVGKGTLVSRLLQRHPKLWLSVSATTRSPREGEQDGTHYFFHSREGFEALLAEGGLLEWAEFAGNCYGTPRAPVQDRLQAGSPVLLEIELEGLGKFGVVFPMPFRFFWRLPVLRCWNSAFVVAALMRKRRSSVVLSGRGKSLPPVTNLTLLLSTTTLIRRWSTLNG